MILSDRFRYIFIKTKKTAGTSLEMALSKHVGPSDVVTPLSPEEEAKRRQLTGNGAQNYKKPPADWTWRDLVAVASARAKKRRKHARGPVAFYQHMPASELCSAVGAERWNSYLKFSIERNPWDRTVSFYYWIYHGRQPRETFREFVLSGRSYPVRRTNYEIYSIAGRPVLDVVLRYEQLSEDLESLAERIGYPESLATLMGSINAKGQYRPRVSYRDYYDDDTRRIVALQFAREIAFMGYEF